MCKAYILIGVMAYSLLGCSGGKMRQTPGTVSLTNAEMSLVRNINAAQADVITAAHQALGAAPTDSKPSPAPADKMQKMVKLIQDGQCQQMQTPAADQYKLSWQATWQVSGAKCPLELGETSAFNLNQRKWTMSRQLSFKSAEFKDASGLDQLAVHGSLQAGGATGGTSSVFGKVSYAPFTVTGVGVVSAEVLITPENDNGGTAELTINAGDLVAVGRVRWVGAEYTLFANGDVVDAKTFADLFSSFQLLEIMDRAQKMK